MLRLLTEHGAAMRGQGLNEVDVLVAAQRYRKGQTLAKIGVQFETARTTPLRQQAFATSMVHAISGFREEEYASPCSRRCAQSESRIVVGDRVGAPIKPSRRCVALMPVVAESLEDHRNSRDAATHEHDRQDKDFEIPHPSLPSCISPRSHRWVDLGRSG